MHRIRRLGTPIHIGIDRSSTLLPIVAFMPLSDIPIVRLYKLSEKSSPRGYAAGYRAVHDFISLVSDIRPDPNSRLHLNVCIERAVVPPGAAGRGMGAIKQAECTGAIQAALAEYGARITDVSPGTWKKKVLGHGSLDKRGVASAVRQRWPDHFNLIAGSQDLIDAYCIARYAASLCP